MKNVQFRKCTIKDLAKLSTISIETFVSAFGEQNSKEDMQTYIATAFSIERIREELTNQYSAFYFAEAENNIIGYLKINSKDAQTEPIKNGLEIERIYILSTYQRIGIGQLMMDKAFAIANELKKTTLWLGVWNENQAAIRFYQRNGFKKFAEHDFYLGKDLQTDWLMKISL